MTGMKWVAYQAWGEEDLAALKRLVAEGRSGGQIAKLLHRSRSSILGKMYRMGLRSVTPGVNQTKFMVNGKELELQKLYYERRMSQLAIAAHFGVGKATIHKEVKRMREKLGDTEARENPGAFKSKDGRRPVRSRTLVAPERPPAAPVHMKDLQPETRPMETAVSLMDLREGACRWPLSEPRDMLYCGAQAVGAYPYCAHHCSRAYRAA